MVDLTNNVHHHESSVHDSGTADAHWSSGCLPGGMNVVGVGVSVIAWRGGCAARCLFVMIYYSLFADRSKRGKWPFITLPLG